jgi:hypothetical protein
MLFKSFILLGSSHYSISGTSCFSVELIRCRKYSNFWRNRDLLRMPCARRPATSSRGMCCCYAVVVLWRFLNSRRLVVPAPPVADELRPAELPKGRPSQSAVGTNFNSLSKRNGLAALGNIYAFIRSFLIFYSFASIRLQTQ